MPSHSAFLKRCGFPFSRDLLFTMVHTTDVLGIGSMAELTYAFFLINAVVFRNMRIQAGGAPPPSC